jgi:hypothetical protein
MHPVGNLHQAHQIDRPGDTKEVALGEVEVAEQELGHRFRAVVGDLEADGITKVSLRQFALDLGAQILDRFFVDEQVAVARDAELVAAKDFHAGEQFVDELMQDRRQEDEAVFAVAEFAWQPDDARQDAWRLHDGRVRAAPEGIAPFEFDGKVEALVEHAREGVRGVEADRGDHRHHFAEEEGADPFALGGAPVAAFEEANAFTRQLRQDLFIKQRVLFLDQCVRFVS